MKFINKIREFFLGKREPEKLVFTLPKVCRHCFKEIPMYASVCEHCGKELE